MGVQATKVRTIPRLNQTVPLGNICLCSPFKQAITFLIESKVITYNNHSFLDSS